MASYTVVAQLFEGHWFGQLPLSSFVQRGCLAGIKGAKFEETSNVSKQPLGWQRWKSRNDANQGRLYKIRGMMLEYHAFSSDVVS